MGKDIWKNLKCMGDGVSLTCPREGKQEANSQMDRGKAFLPGIDRIIASSRNIEGAFDRFSEKVSAVIPFAHSAISIIQEEQDAAFNAYVSGMDVIGRRYDDLYPLGDSIDEIVINSRTSLLIQKQNQSELVDHSPALSPPFQASLGSMMLVPLFSQQELASFLHFWSVKPSAYNQIHRRVTENIRAHISEAVASIRVLYELRYTQNATEETILMARAGN